MRIALYHRALSFVLNFAIFQSENDFRDFEGKNAQVKYDSRVKNRRGNRWRKEEFLHNNFVD